MPHLSAGHFTVAFVNDVMTKWPVDRLPDWDYSMRVMLCFKVIPHAMSVAVQYFTHSTKCLNLSYYQQ